MNFTLSLSELKLLRVLSTIMNKTQDFEDCKLMMTLEKATRAPMVKTADKLFKS